METVIKSVNERLEITCVKEVNLEWKNKFNAIINKQTIKNWCKDNHIFAINISPRDGRFFVEVKELAECCKVRNISEARARCRDLIAFVNDLPEVDSTDSSNKQLEEDKKFVREIIETWDETNTRMGTSGAILLGRDSDLSFEVLYRRISESLLKQMFEAWLKEYDK
jgi:predicted RNase H-like HicB family nuclease